MSINIDERVCKGCGLCVHFCKEGVLRISGRLNEKGHPVAEADQPEKCKLCHLCEIGCPDFAIYIEREKAVGDPPVFKNE
jgi:2-oxoglutarate ferredoxin oxidoreductase subunit delta